MLCGRTKTKILLEYVSANPTGDLHIDMLNAAVGDSLANILIAGYDVTREYYINDAGNQITNLARSIETRFFEALGDTSHEMPADGYNGKDIVEIGKDLAKTSRNERLPDEERLKHLGQLGVDYEMDKLKKIYQISMFILIIGLVKHHYTKMVRLIIH